MKDALIILWPYRKSEKWYRTMVSKLICFFTNSSYTHAAVYVDGIMYESQVMNKSNGAMRTVGLPYQARNCRFLKLIEPLSEKKRELLVYNLERKVLSRVPYNFMKIAVLMFVYPTKRFWNWIGWVPFGNEVYGYVCSTFVDTAFKEIGVDLLGNNSEEYTSPGDFMSSYLLETIT